MPMQYDANGRFVGYTPESASTSTDLPSGLVDPKKTSPTRSTPGSGTSDIERALAAQREYLRLRRAMVLKQQQEALRKRINEAKAKAEEAKRQAEQRNKPGGEYGAGGQVQFDADMKSAREAQRAAQNELAQARKAMTSWQQSDAGKSWNNHFKKVLEDTDRSDKAWSKELERVASMTYDERVKTLKERKIYGTDRPVDITAWTDANLRGAALTPEQVLSLMDPETPGLSDTQKDKINRSTTKSAGVLADSKTGKALTDATGNTQIDVSSNMAKKARAINAQQNWLLMGPADRLSEAGTVISYMTGTMDGIDEKNLSEHVRMILEHDPNVRFADPDGNTVNPKTGKPYTVDDYLDPEQKKPLALSSDTVKLLVTGDVTNTPAPGIVDGMRVPGIARRENDTRKFMSSGEYDFYLRQMQRDNPLQFAAFQKKLFDAGYFAGGSTKYKPHYGMWDADTAKAVSDFVSFNAESNLEFQDSFDKQLSDQSSWMSTEARNAGGGGGGGGGHSWSASDPIALNSVVDSAAQKLIGRNLTDIERDQIVKSIQSAEAAEGAKTSGAIVAVDPSARAEELVRQAFPNDTKAHGVAAAFDMFANTLNAGLGLGSGSTTFGSTRLPTGTMS